MNESIKVKDIIKKAEEIFIRTGIESPDTDAFELMDYVAGIDKKTLLSDPDATVTQEEAVRYHALVMDRARRIPLQHITGRAFFYGLEFKVNGNVLVPRFDTEILVEEAMKELKADSRVLDVCTGSGCIITALDVGGEKKSSDYNFKEGVATDISPEALKVAKENARLHDASNISFICGDLFEGVEGCFDIIVSNPPYIAAGQIDGLAPEVSRFDPRIALDGGEDGLVFYRRIIARAGCFLKKHGKIFLEIGYDQGRAVSGMLKDAGFEDVEIIKDYGGNDRVVKGGM